jgi:hypothetical protein
MPDILWMLRISWPTASLISGWLGPVLVWTVQAAVISFLVRLCRWLVGATRRG